MADHRKAVNQIEAFSLMTNSDKDSEECSSTSDESDTAQQGMATTWEIRVLNACNTIFDGIRSLYRISTFLRWSRSSSEWLQSSNSTMPSHDALAATLDYAFILGKIRQWRSSTISAKEDEGTGQAVTENEFQRNKRNNHEGIADIAFFCQRLTRANILRRKQFHYWDEHPDVPEPQAGVLDDAAAREHHPEDQSASSSCAALSNVASSDSECNNDEGQWRTVYARPVVERSNNEVPEVPKCTEADARFECPFCRLVLDSKLM